MWLISDDEAPVPPDGAKPTFTERPVIRQFDDCQRIIFDCKLVADPKPTIEWLLNGKLINEDSKHKYNLTSDKHNHNVSLEILNVGAEDAGTYMVKAKNKHGEGYATINLNFDSGKPNIPDGKPPRFPKKPTIRQKGGTLILECLLEANPFPEITWSHGSDEIVDGARHRIVKKDADNKDTYILSLEIKDPTIEDGGQYKCHAVNELGESNANIALNFQSMIFKCLFVCFFFFNII